MCLNALDAIVSAGTALLTQAQLAARLSVTQSTVGKYERGALQPNLEMLVQLCKVLEVSADYLLGINDETGGRMV